MAERTRAFDRKSFSSLPPMKAVMAVTAVRRSTRYARGSCGIEQLPMSLDVGPHNWIAHCREHNEVDLTAKQADEVVLEADVRAESIQTWAVVELDQEVGVAPLRVETTAHQRAEHLQAPDVIPATRVSISFRTSSSRAGIAATSGTSLPATWQTQRAAPLRLPPMGDRRGVGEWPPLPVRAASVHGRS